MTTYKCPECKSKITLKSEIAFLKKNGLCFACADEVRKESMSLELDDERKQEVKDDEIIREICEAFDIPIYE